MRNLNRDVTDNVPNIQSLNITAIQVTKFTDGKSTEVTLISDLPEGVWPFTGFAKFKVEITQSQVTQYIETHFPNVPTNVLTV